MWTVSQKGELLGFFFGVVEVSKTGDVHTTFYDRIFQSLSYVKLLNRFRMSRQYHVIT